MHSPWFETSDSLFDPRPDCSYHMISRILVPAEGSEMAQQALEYALENHPNAEVTVLHVVGGHQRWER